MLDGCQNVSNFDERMTDAKKNLKSKQQSTEFSMHIGKLVSYSRWRIQRL